LIPSSFFSLLPFSFSVLLLHGEEDKIVFHNESQKAAKKLEQNHQAELHFIRLSSSCLPLLLVVFFAHSVSFSFCAANVGHVPFEELPDVFLNFFYSFLVRLKASSSSSSSSTDKYRTV
jgi:pimeloyl-ACP methyl ester carboxylesterase